MTMTAIPVPASLKRQLNPRRFPNMSPKMIAYIGYLFGEAYTDPQVFEMAVSADEDILYIRKSGECGFNDLESYSDFRSNWAKLIDFPGVGLTPGDRLIAVALFNAIPATIGHRPPPPLT